MKLLLKLGKALSVLVVILVVAYFLGPKVEKPDLTKVLPEVSSNLIELNEWIENKESLIKRLKPDNEARIVWFDSVPTKTPYSIVYLHGWSASSKEGDPIHREIAKRFGCNLYLPRLTGHGIAGENLMLDVTASDILASAKEAIAIAKQLGNKIIIMATSTGGTLALHLAGGDPDIAGLILYSPNIEIYDKNAKLLAGPWGLQLAKMVKKGNFHEFQANTEKQKYWTTKYRVEALTHLQSLVDYTMKKEVFNEVTQPTFVGYFYKNDSVQDKVISVPAVLEMYKALGTAPELKRKVAFSEVNDHVLACSITSKDLASVRIETTAFFEEILKLKPTENDIEF